MYPVALPSHPAATPAPPSFRYRAHVAAICTLCFATLTACGDGSADAPTSVVLPPPQLSAYCLGTVQECSTISAAIGQLEGHDDPMCQALGAVARIRFNSATDGFEVTSFSGYGYVEAWEDPPNSGDWHTTGVTYLGTRSFEPGELGNTVAHEEVHHDG